MENGLDNWLYENLFVVLLAGFSGLEIVRRMVQFVWSELQHVPFESAMISVASVSRLATNRFAKEQITSWPEPYLTGDVPVDIELDRHSDFQQELRLCSGDCPGL